MIVIFFQLLIFGQGSFDTACKALTEMPRILLCKELCAYLKVDLNQI